MADSEGPARSVENPQGGHSPAAAPGHPDDGQVAPATPVMDTPQGTQNGEIQAFLEAQPEADRAALAALPPATLDRLRKGTMMQSDYSRKRAEETAQLRALEQQNALLAQQAQATQVLLERTAGANGQPNGPASPEDMAKALYEAGTPQEYLDTLGTLVEQRASRIVEERLENNPMMRQLQATAALHSLSSNAPEGASDVDVKQGIQSMQESLRARGVDPAQLEGPALITLAEPHIAAAAARRQLAEAQANAKRGAPVRPVTPPVSGYGAQPPAPPPSVNEMYDHTKTTLDQRIAATQAQLGLTPEQVREIMKNS